MPGGARSFLERTFGLDSRSLAAFRIGLGLVLLADLALRARDLGAHYALPGALPPWFEPAGPAWSLHRLSGDVRFEAALFVLQAALAVLLAAGLKSRFAAAASWALLLSLHRRNELVLDGGDVLLRLGMFWAMFLPIGETWSLDARGRPVAPRRHVSAAAAGLVLQVLSTYLFAGALKLGDPLWRSGEGLVRSTAATQWATSLGKALAAHPAFLAAAGRPAAWLETLGPLLALFPGRWPALAFFSVFHLATAALFGVVFFSAVGLLMWVPLLPGRVWGSEAKERVRGGPAWAEAACAAALLFCLGSNLASLPRLGFPWAPALQRAGYALGLNQGWIMYTTDDFPEPGWLVVHGALADGKEADLLYGKNAVSWDEPASVPAALPGFRWGNYLDNLVRMRSEPFFESYALHLCRGGPEGLRRVEIDFMRTARSPEGRPEPPRKIRFWSEDCPGAG